MAAFASLAHFQLVPDPWDRDLPRAPVVVTLTRRRRRPGPGHESGPRLRLRPHQRQTPLPDRRALAAYLYGDPELDRGGSEAAEAGRPYTHLGHNRFLYVAYAVPD